MEVKKQYSVFVSHNHADKKIARRVASDLDRVGVKVWLDEAELNIGDSLVSKISQAIFEIDFLIVILTPQSIQSDWVQKEVGLAMNGEEAYGKVKVLPLLFEDCELPDILDDKLYGDFTTKKKYYYSFLSLMKRFDIDYENDIKTSADRLTELVKNPVFENLKGILLNQFENDNAYIQYVIKSDLNIVDLVDFLRLIWKPRMNLNLYLFGSILSRFICESEFEPGIFEEFCENQKFGQLDCESLHNGMRQNNDTLEFVAWCHNVHIKLKSDNYFYFFLSANIQVISQNENLINDTISYLLFPDRGPGNFNFDSVTNVLSNFGEEKSKPLISRCITWINDGKFDTTSNQNGNFAIGTYYSILSYSKNINFEDVKSRNFERLDAILRESDKSRKSIAMGHLWEMYSRRYSEVEKIKDLFNRYHSDYLTYDQQEFVTALSHYYDDYPQKDSGSDIIRDAYFKLFSS